MGASRVAPWEGTHTNMTGIYPIKRYIQASFLSTVFVIATRARSHARERRKKSEKRAPQNNQNLLFNN